MTDNPKPKVATVAFASCFGCHMSLLDIDDRILKLAELVEFDRSPINDIKELGECMVGIIEGGIANSENLEVLHEFREKCQILVVIGDCATTGGIPAMRNTVPIKECLQEAYVDGPSVVDGAIPNDPEIPIMLDKVYPVHEVVKVDYHLPGCPPSADAIWETLVFLLSGKEKLELPYELIKYD